MHHAIIHDDLADNRIRETKNRPARSRSITTAHGYAERYNPPEEEPVPEAPRITIPRLNSRNISPGQEAARPTYSRTQTFDVPSRNLREESPARRISRVPTEPTAAMAGRGSLRPVRRADTFADEYEDDHAGISNHRRDRSPPSPATSQGSQLSRAISWTAGASDLAVNGKKAPPPPPPSRAKKPPPPPPPMKRSALSGSETSHY